MGTALCKQDTRAKAGRAYRLVASGNQRGFLVAHEALEKLAENIRTINARIVEGEELIEAMRDAGEDVIELDTSMRELKRRKLRWESMLQARGIEV